MSWKVISGFVWTSNLVNHIWTICLLVLLIILPFFLLLLLILHSRRIFFSVGQVLSLELFLPLPNFFSWIECGRIFHPGGWERFAIRDRFPSGSEETRPFSVRPGRKVSPRNRGLRECNEHVINFSREARGAG